MSYENIGEIVSQLSQFIGIKLNVLFAILMLLLEIPHYNTFRNWKTTNKEFKHLAKGYLILLFIAILGLFLG